MPLLRRGRSGGGFHTALLKGVPTVSAAAAGAARCQPRGRRDRERALAKLLVPQASFILQLSVPAPLLMHNLGAHTFHPFRLAGRIAKPNQGLSPRLQGLLEGGSTLAEPLCPPRETDLFFFFFLA